MNDIRSILRIAAGRLHFSAYLVWLHQAAAGAAALALLLIVVSKLTPAARVPWSWVAPALALTAGLAALGLWWRRRQNEVQVAIAVDQRLELREKLSTALQIAGREDAFARAAVEDAVSVARDARTREQVRRRFPVEPPRRWWLAPSIALVAVLAALFIPQGDLFARSPQREPAAQPIPVEVQTTLASAAEMLKQNEALGDELKDVLDQLRVDRLDPTAMKTPEGARREALKKLTDVTDRLEEIVKGEKGKTAEALSSALSKLKTSEQDGLASELTKAMKSGDFQAAKEAIEKLQQMAENGEMSPEQKEQLAKALDDLSKQLARMAEDRKALEDALRQAGMDPNLAQNPQQLQQQIQNNQNLSQQQKQQLQQMAQAQQAASQMCQGMAGAMGQMAQGMQSGNGQQSSQGAGQMAQMLSDAENLRQMMKEAQAMANRIAGQCQGLGQGLGQGMGQGGMGQSPGQGAGGEAPLAKTPTSTRIEKIDNKDNNADIIASTMFDGPIVKGESTIQFRQAALSNAESYADGVKDEQIPRKYHEALQRYFGELREKARRASPPAEGGSQRDGAAGNAGSGSGS